MVGRGKEEELKKEKKRRSCVIFKHLLNENHQRAAWSFYGALCYQTGLSEAIGSEFSQGLLVGDIIHGAAIVCAIQSWDSEASHEQSSRILLVVDQNTSSVRRLKRKLSSGDTGIHAGFDQKNVASSRWKDQRGFI